MTRGRPLFAIGRERGIVRAAALARVFARGLRKVLFEVPIGRTRCRREILDVVPRYAIVTGVVLGAEEPGCVRYLRAAFRQQGPHLGPVGHRREQSRIGSAVPPRTRPAIVGGEVRIVLAV